MNSHTPSRNLNDRDAAMEDHGQGKAPDKRAYVKPELILLDGETGEGKQWFLFERGGTASGPS